MKRRIILKLEAIIILIHEQKNWELYNYYTWKYYYETQSDNCETLRDNHSDTRSCNHSDTQSDNCETKR